MRTKSGVARMKRTKKTRTEGNRERGRPVAVAVRVERTGRPGMRRKSSAATTTVRRRMGDAAVVVRMRKVRGEAGGVAVPLQLTAAAATRRSDSKVVARERQTPATIVTVIETKTHALGWDAVSLATALIAGCPSPPPTLKTATPIITGCSSPMLTGGNPVLLDHFLISSFSLSCSIFFF